MPRPAGPAHVATVSFLASRATPAGGFWVALAGGVALARVAQRRGAREGFGASIAAMLESVAIIGPTRVSVPFTQALTAPLLGRLEARSVRPATQALACGLIRLAHNTAVTAFFIWVVAGGLDAYAGTYDTLAGRLGLDVDSAAALTLTGAGLLAWAVFASVVQVGVYRRGLRRWHDSTEQSRAEDPVEEEEARGAGRFDPRAVALAAVVAFALLLTSTAWALLAAVAVWLALAWLAARADSSVVPTGLALTGLLAGSSLAFGLLGGVGAELALRRALRIALLVLAATWLRAAAGPVGLREVFRRTLGRLRRLPSLPEAVRTLDQIGSERRLIAAGRSLAARLGTVRRRPLPVLDTVLDWVAHESARFEPGDPPASLTLRTRPLDALLVALAAAPAAALIL
jgi:hypothetical protein